MPQRSTSLRRRGASRNRSTSLLPGAGCPAWGRAAQRARSGDERRRCGCPAWVARPCRPGVGIDRRECGSAALGGAVPQARAGIVRWWRLGGGAAPQARGAGLRGRGRIGRQPRRGRRPSALRVVRVQVSRWRRAARQVALTAPRVRRWVIAFLPSVSGGSRPDGRLRPSTVTNRGFMIRGLRPWLSSRSRWVIVRE